MKDRGMKKWRPFNSVATAAELLGSPEPVSLPSLSSYEIEECEEMLKSSLYTHSKVRVTYIENGKLCTLEDYVVSLDPIKKDIIFSHKKINFRQLVAVHK